MHQQHCQCLETLSNTVRMAILAQLEARPATVTALADAIKKERSLVSHALKSLKDCNLLIAEKKGREIYYSLNTKSPLFVEQKGNIFTIIESHAKQCCTTCAKTGTKPFTT